MEIYDKLSSLELVSLKLSELGYDRNHITIDSNVKHSKNIETLMNELFPPNKTYDIPDDVNDIEYSHCFKRSGSKTKNNIGDSVESNLFGSSDLEFNDIDCNVVMYGKFKSTINPNIVNDKTKLTKEVYKSVKLSVDDVNETIGLMNKSTDSIRLDRTKSKSIKSTSTKPINSTKETKDSKQKYYDYITSCQKIKGILGDSTTVNDKLTGGVSAESILDNLKD